MPCELEGTHRPEAHRGAPSPTEEALRQEFDA
jgi:hypothetical protein